MNHRTWIPYLAVSCIALSSCEQKDDQALIKVYEVFQRDMQARDDAQKSVLDGIQEQLQTVTQEIETLKQGLADISGAESNEKLAATVAEAVAKKMTEQNAATIAEMKKQIETLQSAAPPSASTQPVERIPGPNGTSYRPNPPVEPTPAPTTTREKDPSRKTYRFEF